MAFARIVDALARGASFELYGDGSQSRSFTYVGDVVDATIRALDAPPGVYNVGGGEEATLREALDLLEEVAGRPLDVVYGPAQPGDNRRTKADTSRLEAAVGWRATTPLRAGLARQWEWALARSGSVSSA
jgi:nucleoside-diphosphate-sugar epimerase